MAGILSDPTVIIALAALFGTIAVALINGVFTVIGASWLEPRKQRKIERDRGRELVKALYNEIIHMYLFLLDKQTMLAASPENFFHLDVYRKAREDPVKFFMLPTAHELDNLFMRLISLEQELIAIKNGKISGHAETTINSAKERIEEDIVCSGTCCKNITNTLQFIPFQRERILENLKKKRDQAIAEGKIPNPMPSVVKAQLGISQVLRKK
jgi:hypothetical protein